MITPTEASVAPALLGVEHIDENGEAMSAKKTPSRQATTMRTELAPEFETSALPYLPEQKVSTAVCARVVLMRQTSPVRCRNVLIATGVLGLAGWAALRQRSLDDEGGSPPEVRPPITADPHVVRGGAARTATSKRSLLVRLAALRIPIWLMYTVVLPFLVVPLVLQPHLW
jgi:hypothetical protein